MYQTCVLVAACLLFEKEAYVKYTKACQVELGLGEMLDMKFLGGLHGVAIGVMDDKSIIFLGLGPKIKVPTLAPLTGHRRLPP